MWGGRAEDGIIIIIIKMELSHYIKHIYDEPLFTQNEPVGFFDFTMGSASVPVSVVDIIDALFHNYSTINLNL